MYVAGPLQSHDQSTENRDKLELLGVLVHQNRLEVNQTA